MSGIFGIFNRNGKPVEEKTVNTMLDAMSYWEPDEKDMYIDGSVALGHTMLWNTPESKYEHFPLQKDAFVLTMDARIDNRNELEKEIELPDRPLFEIGDSEFILGAYKKWGEECPKYLLGDFSFVIWDEKKQQLFCARDHIGIKSFYYCQSDDAFIFSNDMKIFKHSKIPYTLNMNSVAYYLKGEEHLHYHTFIKGITKLPPSSTLIVSQRNVTIKRYWFPENGTPVHFDTIEEYAEELRDLLMQAVRDRIRSAYTITSHLSGGLDSSGITAIASRLLKAKNKKLYAFNWVPEPRENDDQNYYEWAYSKLLAKYENIEHNYIDMNEENLAKVFLELDITTNDTVDLWYEFLLRKKIKEINSRVVLSGWGGDEIVTSYGRGYFTEIFLSGKIFEAIRKVRSYKCAQECSYMKLFKTSFNTIVWHALPELVRCRLRKTRCYKPLPLCCVKKDFLEYTKNIKYPGEHYLQTSVRNVQLAYLKQGHIQQRTESWSVSGMKDKIEYRYPLLDKRLVEFALNIPSELFIDKSGSRIIYRRAMKNILPDMIRLNSEKDEPRRIAAYHNATLNALRLAIEKIDDGANDIIDKNILLETIKNADLSIHKDRNDIIAFLESLVRSLMILKIQKD